MRKCTVIADCLFDHQTSEQATEEGEGGERGASMASSDRVHSSLIYNTHQNRSERVRDGEGQRRTGTEASESSFVTTKDELKKG